MCFPLLKNRIIVEYRIRSRSRQGLDALFLYNFILASTTTTTIHTIRTLNDRLCNGPFLKTNVILYFQCAPAMRRL